jgi:TPR repeat protein
MALLEQAAGQGHAYAMHELAGIHAARTDHTAAAGWYRRAADAGSGQAANTLSGWYTLGCGRAWQIMPAGGWGRG